ncbi:DUF4419 domain-containing protein [Dactylosporangium sp. CS-047395]|uniref:DUF4419 domain-containing protein n=1 Tax=Dactylosporangium sp. CS-047395 TaxID=3239936 RepID=UPI003D8F8138
MVTFAVDDVTPADTRLATRPAGTLFPEALAVGVEPGLEVLEPDRVHPLLGAVATAFAEHRPLVLSPDAVWLTIAQGVAQHVRLNAEQLRPRLVRHAGKKALKVVANRRPGTADEWAETAEVFAKLLAGEIDDAALFECDFSTSTEIERTAGRVVLLDAYSPYFSLWLTALCGIPAVTVTGTVEDWRRIRARVDAIEEFGLEQWCRSLRPIADQFVCAAEGAPDVAFWQRIYSPADAYGGDVVTGWVTRFYPYLNGGAVPDRPNPMLELPIGEPRDTGPDTPPGLTSTDVPATLSRVVVNLNDRAAGENVAVALHAGLIGVAQDAGGALRPVAGWYVAPAPIDMGDVLDRLVAGHETGPSLGLPDDSPQEVVALYHKIGSASLFGGRWRLVPVEEPCYVLRLPGNLWAQTVFDLDDGRSIAWAFDERTMTTYWIAGRIAMGATRYELNTLADDPADVPVLGTSLAMLLDAALDSGGDIAHLETGRLDQVGR